MYDCCIPGSHKSPYKLPKPIADHPEAMPCVIIPKAPAGSLVLFTEALTHGTAAWRGKYERRALRSKSAKQKSQSIASTSKQLTGLYKTSIS